MSASNSAMSAGNSAMSAGNAMEKIRVEGSWVGVIEVDLESWTVDMLRNEVASRLECGPQAVMLFFLGGVLRSCAGLTLKQLGFRDMERILSSRMNNERNEKEQVFLEGTRWRRFTRIRENIERNPDESNTLAGNDDRSNEQEAQSESWVDQRATFYGWMIHWKAKSLIIEQEYKEAIESLDLAERVLKLCNPENLEMLDNVVLVNIEMVWCNLMLEDIAGLTAAGDRLKKAREGLEIALERDFSRITRFNKGVPRPEIAITMRLELLEGVVAYYNGRLEDAVKSLKSAEEKYMQLDVPEESVAYIESLGFEETDISTALRLNDNDVSKAVEFLHMEAENRERKHQQECTPSGLKKVKDANIVNLKELVTIGFDIFLAIEALRKNNNDVVKAFTDLTNPRTKSLLEDQQIGTKRRRTIASGPGERVTDVDFSIVFEPERLSRNYMALSPSFESDHDYESSEDSEEEEEEELEDAKELVYDLGQVTAPPDYEIEYYTVGGAIFDYLNLLVEQEPQLFYEETKFDD